jgi:hypothetical protein
MRAYGFTLNARMPPSSPAADRNMMNASCDASDMQQGLFFSLRWSV